MDIRLLPARKAIAGLSLLACGVVGGATIATVSTANAADPAPSATVSADTDTDARGGGETALTGDVLAKVKAAVAAEYPDASFDRVETDHDGDYEAHITTAAGDQVTVELDQAYAITGTE